MEEQISSSIVFISYASEDSHVAERLCEDLKHAGLIPWLDKKDLIAGQNWKKQIEVAIRKSRYFIPLFSKTSVKKRGYAKKEYKFALEFFKRYYSPNLIFYIPVRLDDCIIPYKELEPIHRADLFPIDDDNTWKEGVKQILRAIEKHRKLCFFIFPRKQGTKRREHSDKIYFHLQKCLKKQYGYEVISRDQISRFGRNEIDKHLFEDELVVADVTHADANVMYELGLRHAFRKHTIEIGDEKYNKVPSDIQGIGLINYNFNALEDFKNSITNRITKIDKSNKPSSPISDDVPYPIFMISGQQEVFDFLRKNREKTYEFYGMWCYSHFKVNDLVNYFSEERSLNLPHRTRLINTLTVDQNLIREHIRNSENDIRAGNYLIYSTSESSHEIVICHMHRDDVDDVELAIQLIPHSANKTVDMAIFSYDNHFVEKMKSRYDNSKGESFLPGKHFDNDLENWLYNSRHNMIANLEKIIEVEKNKYKQFLVKS